MVNQTISLVKIPPKHFLEIGVEVSQLFCRVIVDIAMYAILRGRAVHKYDVLNFVPALFPIMTNQKAFTSSTYLKWNHAKENKMLPEASTRLIRIL